MLDACGQGRHADISPAAAHEPLRDGQPGLISTRHGNAAFDPSQRGQRACRNISYTLLMQLRGTERLPPSFLACFAQQRPGMRSLHQALLRLADSLSQCAAAELQRVMQQVQRCAYGMGVGKNISKQLTARMRYALGLVAGVSVPKSLSQGDGDIAIALLALYDLLQLPCFAQALAVVEEAVRLSAESGSVIDMQQYIGQPEHAALFNDPSLLEARRGIVAAVDLLAAYKAAHTSETKVFMCQVTSGARAVICLPREEFLEVCSFIADSPGLYPHPAMTAAEAQQEVEAAVGRGLLAPFRREFSVLRANCLLKHLSAADMAVVETQVAASAAAFVFQQQGWSRTMQALRMLQLAAAAHATSTRHARTRQLQQQQQQQQQLRSAAGGSSSAVAAGGIASSPAATAPMQAQQGGAVQQQQQQQQQQQVPVPMDIDPGEAAAADYQQLREDVKVLAATWVQCETRLAQARAAAPGTQAPMPMEID